MDDAVRKQLLLNRSFRELVKKHSLELICKSYKQMYEMIMDPVNEYREPLTIVPRTPEQVVKLLS